MLTLLTSIDKYVSVYLEVIGIMISGIFLAQFREWLIFREVAPFGRICYIIHIYIEALGVQTK